MNEMDIKVIAPITEYTKTFKTIDEFNLFASKNKAQLDSQTTHVLNKLYHIDGYRITKIKGELMLKKFDDTQKRYLSKKDEHDLYESLRDELQSQIDSLQKDVSAIKESVNAIIKFLNPNAEDDVQK